MLELLRRYQRYIFGIVTFVVIASFSFAGAYSTFDREPTRQDPVVGKTLTGHPVTLSELQNLIRFISKDREDIGEGAPNFCNDGVLRYDLLRTGLADLIVEQYFVSFLPDLSTRLEKAKRFKLYVHPKKPSISVVSLWNQFLPHMSRQFEALQKTERLSPATFKHLSRLYQQEAYLKPETLRQFLAYQEQLQGADRDPNLARADLSLFGFKSTADWFGPQFMEKAAYFILHAAAKAEAQGYFVSLEEATADLIHNFEESMSRLKGKLSFAEQLRLLGLDERTAAKTWQKVLLFRRYFQDVGYSTFVDRLPYKQFANYAREEHLVDEYRWPLTLKNLEELHQFQAYLKAVSPSPSWPTEFYSLEEVEKKSPELVQTPYLLKVAQVTATQAGLRIPIKEVWDWQLKEENWKLLGKEFPTLPQKGDTREERFAALEKLPANVRSRLDSWSRAEIVKKSPSWIDAAIEVAPKEPLYAGVSEKQVYLPNGAKLPAQAFFEGTRVADGSSFYRLEDAEKQGEKQIVTFEKAKSVLPIPKDVRTALKSLLTALDANGKHEWKAGEGPESHYISQRFVSTANRAFEDLKKNGQDPQWIGSSEDPFRAQWSLAVERKNIQRTSREEWMKNEVLKMIPNQWSPIRISSEGPISFFYLKQKNQIEEPVLEQINFGYETLAADAQKVLAKGLLEAIQQEENSL